VIWQIGARLAMVSIMPFWTCGLMITLVPTATNSVWPSGLAFADGAQADRARGAALVVDDDLLADHRRHDVGQLAGIDVRAAARGIADDEGDRAGGQACARKAEAGGERPSRGRGRGGG
jgi:hypothetical protein